MKPLNEELVMTQEDKELLLKDLCARTPYGVKVQYMNNIFVIDYVSPMYGEVKLDTSDNWTVGVSEVKPYLFPLSSMTEEQLHELKEITDLKYNYNNLELIEWTETHKTLEFWLEEAPQYKVIEVFDWLNKNHFDYRCLIERELAIDATGLNIY